MYIALDVMGTDYGPATVLSGASKALDDFPDLHLILVGNFARMMPAAERLGLANHPRVQFEHAEEAVAMNELSTVAVRAKKNASISVCTELVRCGRAVALVSAGHTGATVASSTIRIRTQPGIDRPCIAALIPAVGGHFVLVDAGANTDCKPNNLAQFAVMGEAYAQTTLKIPEPRIAILSVGDEDVKGNELTKEAFKILAKMPVNFVGNVEGHDLFCHRKADVVVCDGFTGNILLKTVEGFAQATFHWMREAFTRNPYRLAVGHAARPILHEMKSIANYEEVGGAPLLGLNGICIIGHGASSPLAIRNALRLSLGFIKADINTQIQNRLRESGILEKKSDSESLS